MKFGTELVQCPMDMTRETWAEVHRRCDLLEELGFDFASLSHHRFTEGYASSPWTVLTSVALRTTTLTIGCGVLSLPLEHPASVAEQVATVDRAAEGRTFFGVGIGYRRYEYDAVAIPWAERGSRMTEGLELVRRLWAEDDVSHAGRHYEVRGATLFPKPTSPGGPPIWVGANLPVAIERAATLGDAYYGGSIESLPTLGRTVADYRQAAAAAGRPGMFVLKRSFSIGTDGEALRDRWLDGFLEFRARNVAAGIDWVRDPQVEAAVAGGRPDPASMALDHGVVGDPDDCIAAIRRCQEVTGCEAIHIALAQQRGRRDHEEQLRLFAKEVMPAFRAP